MSDLIWREDLIDWLTSRIVMLKGIYGDLGGAVNGVREMVKVMPSAEPERKNGELKTVGFLTCQCSECGAQFHELEYTNFCPNCGTKWSE